MHLVARSLPRTWTDLRASVIWVLAWIFVLNRDDRATHQPHYPSDHHNDELLSMIVAFIPTNVGSYALLLIVASSLRVIAHFVFSRRNLLHALRVPALGVRLTLVGELYVTEET